MLDIEGRNIGRVSGGMSRRTFIRVGAIGAAGLTLADWYQLQAAGKASGGGGKAKAVIQLWMGGGPPHTDTWDPKPNSGDEYTGPYKKPIKAKGSGALIGEKLPLMAKIGDKFALLRGITGPSNAHEIGTYCMQTGTPPSDGLVYPSKGAVIAMKKGEKCALPPYIAIPSALGRFNAAGFLGNQHQPFATGGDPNRKGFRPGGLSPSRGEATLKKRRKLLEAVDGYAREMEKSGAINEMTAHQQKAYGLIMGDAKKAFDMTAENDKVRDRYGRNRFGQSCLLARRLVENEVPFVTVNYGGWDTHKQHFERMDKMLPVLDQAFSALLEDLDQRGLLDTTIVEWLGEFGRTPKVANDPPWLGGRHHFAPAFSVVVAGGGFKGSAVVGTTDKLGEKVIERPIYPWDLSGSMYKLLGIDPMGVLPHPRGCKAYVTPVASGDVASGGLLTEIM